MHNTIDKIIHTTAFVKIPVVGTSWEGKNPVVDLSSFDPATEAPRVNTLPGPRHS